MTIKLRFLVFLFFAVLISEQLSASAMGSLLKRRTTLWRQNASVKPFGKFREYLGPNELNPIRLKAFLDEKEWEIILTTGAERAFITTSLCAHCKGVIGRDINPRVKAYNDFNLLLLMLSTNREDYLRLRATREVIKTIDEDDKNFVPLSTRRRFDHSALLAEIREKLSGHSMDDDDKRYFLENLEAYAGVFYEAQYLSAMLTLIDPEKIVCRDYSAEHFFVDANYLYDDTLFERVQMLALQGNIIFTVGKIDECDDFIDEKIDFIDSSNISDYVDLNFGRYPSLHDATHVRAEYQGYACRYLKAKI